MVKLAAICQNGVLKTDLRSFSAERHIFKIAIGKVRCTLCKSLVKVLLTNNFHTPPRGIFHNSKCDGGQDIFGMLQMKGFSTDWLFPKFS